MAFDNAHSLFPPYKHVSICSVIHSNLELFVEFWVAGLHVCTKQKVVGLGWITRKSSGITKIAGLPARLHITAVKVGLIALRKYDQ